MKTLVIGITGPPAAGKAAVRDILTDELCAKGISVYCETFSNILYETLKLWELEGNRENAQKLAVAMRDTFGPSVLTDTIAAKIRQRRVSVAIIDGIRWLPDARLIRSFPNNLLIAINANERKRWRWTRERKQKAGEENITLEQFRREDQAENERYIPQIAAGADIQFENVGTLTRLRQRFKDITRDIIIPRIEH